MNRLPLVSVLVFLQILASHLLAQSTAPSANEIARAIFDLTNKERTARGLAPFKENESLDRLSVIQSKNMMDHNFFSHTDHLGRGPGERKDQYFPRLFGGVGENIAYVHGVPAVQLARKFVKIWMDSPGHRANILRPKYSHMGVGITRNGKTYYATQTFGDLVAQMITNVRNAYPYGSEQEFTFEFLGKFPRDKISVFLHFPDKSARFFTSKNSYYTGVGYYRPRWLGGRLFSLTVKFDKGHGDYNLTMGSYENYTPGGLSLRVD